MDILTFLSISIFIGCCIALFIGFTVNNGPKVKLVQQLPLSKTTEARHAFENAEYRLAKSKYIYQFLKRNQIQQPIIDKAKEDIEEAVDRWTHSFKNVVQVRRRSRSASPESFELYERFQIN